jgi:hypothetical protein
MVCFVPINISFIKPVFCLPLYPSASVQHLLGCGQLISVRQLLCIQTRSLTPSTGFRTVVTHFVPLLFVILTSDTTITATPFQNCAYFLFVKFILLSNLVSGGPPPSRFVCGRHGYRLHHLTICGSFRPVFGDVSSVSRWENSLF